MVPWTLLKEYETRPLVPASASVELCFSRSNALSSTNSGCLLPSELSFKAREKDGLLVSW
uniref:Uncharacterized protein n=1 Tax=Serinus canaria TaxID=9135 RepID=A0A8C9UCE0_SERCA